MASSKDSLHNSSRLWGSCDLLVRRITELKVVDPPEEVLPPTWRAHRSSVPRG